MPRKGPSSEQIVAKLRPSTLRAHAVATGATKVASSSPTPTQGSGDCHDLGCQGLGIGPRDELLRPKEVERYFQCTQRLRPKPRRHRHDYAETFSTLAKVVLCNCQIFGDGRLSDVDPELEQFAMNARRAQQRIRGRFHLPDQLTNFQGDLPAAARSRFPSPEAGSRSDASG